MYNTNIEISLSDLKKWFNKEGFKQAEFEKGKDYVMNYWQSVPVSVKLVEREGFQTYHKAAYGGALLVFDVSIEENILVYDCYCPMWLFGMWNKKVSFKEDAGGIFKYRKEGFYAHERFKEFLEKKGKSN